MVRFALIGVSILASLVSAATAQSPVERGSYLVNGILTCGNCHTPRAKGGALDMARAFSGGPQTWDTPAFTVKGSNITPDKETGVGGWSAADLKTAIVEGRRPNGVELAPIMPYGFYKVFTPGDLNAVVVYLQSLQRVSNKVQAPVYKAAFSAQVPAGAEKSMSEAELKDPVRRGFYLVTIGHCMECHTPRIKGRHDFANSLGKGGNEFKLPGGVSVSRNITSHKTAGIGAWSDAEIKAAIVKGVRKDGTKLQPPMAYDMYATMTEADQNAMVAYLRTVPPKE
jgi:mono/diheme cytochrome c family protein